MGEEKYISIPYKVWYEKYKPMEEELNFTKRELEKEKENKEGVLYMTLDYFYDHPMSRNSDRRRLGVLDFSVKDAPKISLTKREEIIRMIKDVIDAFTFSDRGLTLASKEDVQEVLTSVALNKAEIETKINKVNERLDTIPKWKRWLLGLKKV